MREKKIKNRILSFYYNAKLGGLKTFGAWLNVQRKMVKTVGTGAQTLTSKLRKISHRQEQMTAQMLDTSDKILATIESGFVETSRAKIYESQKALKKFKDAKAKNALATTNVNKTQQLPPKHR